MADEDPAYTRWLRQQGCHQCGTTQLIVVHHHTRGTVEPYGTQRTAFARGKGQRAHDSWGFPLCIKDHSQFHSLKGPFRLWGRADMMRWQNAAVAKYQALWAVTG